MKRLINRILIKLGFVLLPPKYTAGWKWYGGYGDRHIVSDWILFGK